MYALKFISFLKGVKIYQNYCKKCIQNLNCTLNNIILFKRRFLVSFTRRNIYRHGLTIKLGLEEKRPWSPDVKNSFFVIIYVYKMFVKNVAGILYTNFHHSSYLYYIFKNRQRPSKELLVFTLNFQIKYYHFLVVDGQID